MYHDLMGKAESNRRAVKKHYDDNKPYYVKKNRRARIRKTEYLIQLRQQPCKDCGNSYPYYVMQFDHVVPRFKPVTSLVSHSWKCLWEEVAKCDIVCANCHAIRTWTRRQRSPMAEAAVLETVE